MATVQVEEVLKGTQKKLDIVNFVNYDTWKDLLIELVEKEKLDPWNIDIVEVVERYISAVKELKVMDLRVPANIILAASILLRLKSNMLSFGVDEEETEEGQIEGRTPPLVQELALRLRPPVKRRLTLGELIEALDEAMKITEVRSARLKSEPLDVPIFVKEVNIEEDMENVYRHIERHADKERMTTLSYLLGAVKIDDVLLGLFIPMLFLANKGRITLMQERFFQEIIIKLN